ncbi:histidine phosphatase family protein [Novosphingobium pentaromativorans]|uniref:Phosphoglycerate/bisphosphoglycerate mutase n=1 Tax=Novosphingobium pentaromativorans US6-1 TaxID=1088721 RepID=G6EIV4_9SPHN|nr:histidine phosphatase family protein [Novosphingobium pentaromativorans]AIT78915.1 phosphoglycerate mutase [Novosphingobium pentaromativorans US6-1]EHJ58713.1 phosphoglycerate/bisphosphoglycerate mutase [Novosphingobium pentaromativorans US6-1]
MKGFVLHLMRHGAPQRPGLMLGHLDEPPLASGVAACAARGAELAFSRICCSDLERAHAPARQIAARRHVPIDMDPRWRELDFGTWDGKAAQHLPADALARFWDDPDSFPPPDGETWSALLQRVGAAVEEMREDSLVLAHGGSIRAAVSYLTGLDHRGVWAFDLPYGALVSLRVWLGGKSAGQIIAIEAPAP